MINEVNAGQTQSNFAFKVPKQEKYSVRGFTSTNDKPRLDARGVYVALVSLDGDPIPAWHTQPIDLQGSLPPPKVKYFDSEKVPPGRYAAYVSVLGQCWYTKKVEASVTTHMKFASPQ
jgi:hypothetical protein